MTTEPHVEIDVGFVLALGDSPEGGEDELDQIAHQPGSLFAGGRGFEGRLETGGIPARGELAPARHLAAALVSLVQILEELLVAESLAVLDWRS